MSVSVAPRASHVLVFIAVHIALQGYLVAVILATYRRKWRANVLSTAVNVTVLSAGAVGTGSVVWYILTHVVVGLTRMPGPMLLMIQAFLWCVARMPL